MPCRNKLNQTPGGRKTAAANVIAIDGPAGSGKSTVAKAVAKRLGLLYVDTGAMYRALTLKALKKGLTFDKHLALVKMTKNTRIRLKMNSDILSVYLDTQDVTQDIRQPAVTEKVRFLAAIEAVRSQMLKLQRKLVRSSRGAVLEGRDIGTVVFPDARYKFYLDADKDVRVQRRFKELGQMVQGLSQEEVSRDIKSRDKTDMERKVAPLAKAKDAVYIDTTDLSVAEVAEKIIQICSM